MAFPQVRCYISDDSYEYRRRLAFRRGAQALYRGPRYIISVENVVAFVAFLLQPFLYPGSWLFPASFIAMIRPGMIYA